MSRPRVNFHPIPLTDSEDAGRKPGKTHPHVVRPGFDDAPRE